MDQQPNDSLFTLNVDQPIKSHLSETARWAQFLGILGVFFSILCLLGGILLLSAMGSVSDLDRYGGDTEKLRLLVGPLGFVVYAIGAAMIFFPSLFMMRFAGKMKSALLSNDQAMLTASFQNLKLLFRFWGIITIIVITFYILMIVAVGSGALLGSS